MNLKEIKQLLKALADLLAITSTVVFIFLIFYFFVSSFKPSPILQSGIDVIKSKMGV
jgi:hypothetical protein